MFMGMNFANQGFLIAMSFTIVVDSMLQLRHALLLASLF